MKKPWSITTTLRNPERLRDFLKVLKGMDGDEWNAETQEKYQILLIKNRIYGFASAQFYNGLSRDQIDLFDDPSQDISFEKAKEIFNAKNYEDPAMRGRQSINPLKKFGFVIIRNGKILFTELGNYFLKSGSDLGETFFRSFIKWQIPNPDIDDYSYEEGYDIKPFLGTLHLINLVNKKMISNGESPKGISRQEFTLFATTLVNFQDIERHADRIIELRSLQEGKNKQEQKEIYRAYQEDFVREFLGDQNETAIAKLIHNIKDYSDNAIRYFRLTRFIFIRGGGFYIDLEPRRWVEISNLLTFDNAKSKTFASREEYLDYMANMKEPKLPWETKEKYKEIVKEIIDDIRFYEKELGVQPKEFSDYTSYDEFQIKDFVIELRSYRRELQEYQNHKESQDIDLVSKYIESLEHIYDEDDKPIALEKYSSLALHALNDALKIQPNYPVGDDNEPTFTAPAGKPDIECFYKNFNAIYEVTMLSGRNQWYNEGQPIMRHLRDFEQQNNDKSAYCIFIAPKLHRDTLSTFWISVKYEYEGERQRIIPLTINNFVELLKTLIQIKQKGKFLSHIDLNRLYDNIVGYSVEAKSVNEWADQIPGIINSWQKQLVA